MIGSLLKRLFAPADPQGASAMPPGQAQSAPQTGPSPASPTTLDLAPDGGPRVVRPVVDWGYAGLVNSSQGFFIFNLFDQGVGWQLYTYNAYDQDQMRILAQLTAVAPPDPVVLDIGANIGVTTVVFARAAGPRGVVHAFEAQRTIYHMLAGNMALNSIDNAYCYYQAVGAAAGSASIPRLDYRKHASFGSIELNRAQQSDAAQQAADGQFDQVPMDSVDALQLPRVDLIKIDVEGMEADVLAGAEQTISRHRPLMYIEYLKSDKAALARTVGAWGYTLYDVKDNFVCIPDGHAGGAGAVSQLTPWTPPAY